MPGAGDLDRRVAIERFAEVRDDFGARSRTWTIVAYTWAMRRDISDGEGFAAGEIQAVRGSRFTVRSYAATKAITTKDRLIEDGDTYEITGIKQTKEGRSRFLELTAIVRNDPD